MGAARRLILAMAVASAAAGACQSAEERCAEAVDPAKQAWSAYLQSLQGVKGAAERDRDGAKAELQQVEKRVDAEAHAKADSLNRKGTSAWYRTHNAARQSLCSDDAACSGLKGKVSQAEMIVKEMDARIGETRALIDALGKPGELPGVEDDFDRRQLLASARETTGAVAEACAGAHAAGSSTQ